MERCNCGASWSNVACRCPWRQPECCRYRCEEPGTWTDEETGEVYCEQHQLACDEAAQ